MGLREQAALDSQSILGDLSGFGWPFQLISPLGTVAELVGFCTDVGTTIDPETGIAVAGRKASVAVSLASLTDSGIGLPVAVADSGQKPWVVTFPDVQGVFIDWKIIEVLPDRAAGVVVLLLELYHASAN
jgi:hypothetical protein